jgi:protein TonB
VEKPKLVAPAPAAPPKTEPKTTPVKTVAKAPSAATKTQPTAAAKKAVPVATASTQEQEQENLLRVYRSNVLKLTYLNTQYPKRSMDLKQQGLVVLKIKLNRQGKVLSVEEEQATNYALLNKAARKAVNKSEPYPEVPTSMQGNDFEISLPFNFKL